MALLKRKGELLQSEYDGGLNEFPQEFLAQIGTIKTVQQVPLDIATDPITGLLIESRIEQEFTDERKKTNTYLKDFPGPMLAEVKLKSGLVGTLTRTLVPDPTSLLVDNLTEDASQHNLGNGWLDQNVIEAPSLFPDLVSSVEFIDLIPDDFKGAVPTYTREITEEGIIDDPPITVPGDLQKSEHQIDVFNKRTTTRTRAGLEFPQILTNQELTEEYGGGVLNVTMTLSDMVLSIDTGLLVTASRTRQIGPTGSALYFKETKELDGMSWPTLIGYEFDPEIQEFVIEEQQVVDAGYSPVPADYTVETVKPIDFVRSQRRKITKDVSAHFDVDSALISYRYHPFQFPGTLDYNRLLLFQHREGYRRTAAMLTKHTIRTWWINSVSPPTVGDNDLGTFDVDVKEIITDTVNVPVFTSNSSVEAQTYPDVLHDDIINTLGAVYPATTPSLTKYYLGTPSGSTAMFGIANIVSGGTGYGIGDSVSALGYTFDVVSVSGAGAIQAVVPSTLPTSGFITISATSLGSAGVTGGGGSGATFAVTEITYDTPTPGSMWVGTEKAIAAQITQTDIPNLWKVMTESVVMR